MLSWISLGWLGIEGGVAILAAVLAGSVALLGFGIDSAIEALASVIVIWRFTGSRTLSPASERTAQRAVAVSFYLLAPYIAAESLRTLILGRHAETSWLGVALAAIALAWCPALGVMKKRLGARLGSAATAGEGRQNLLCAYLAVAVLAGLLANTWFGIWWLDPGVGLLIAALAVREGRKAWRGETCAC
jgi:divalent metal cation (Fe/Co/Zn/Cd) transporter